LLCERHNAHFYVMDKGFKYHVKVEGQPHWVHLSYQLIYAKMSRKHVLRLECPPKSLIYYREWVSQVVANCRDILYVRSDVAFDIPLPKSELFVLSLTGRNMHVGNGTDTHYSNQKWHRQVAGYCRVYDKKAQLLQVYGELIKGELTRFEIVYKPDEKIPMATLVQYPPQFNKLYLCTHAIELNQLKPKVFKQVQGMMRGELEQRDVTYHYRQEIKAEMRKRPTLDFDKAAAEQWEDAITIPCALLGGVVSKVPVA
jgi:hypothetical protein